MNVFLILSSLGVAFYLVLLYNLYREGRERRRHRVETFHEMEIAGESAPLSSGPSAAIVRSAKFSDEALWLPVTKMQMKPVRRMPHQTQTKTVSAATTDRSDRQVKFG